MADPAVKLRASAREAAATTPVADLDPARPDLFATDEIWPILERLRDEDPIHFLDSPEYGPYWSLTRWGDILRVDNDHQTFSSTTGITLMTREARAQSEVRGRQPGFIQMDPPRHDAQRKSVAPAVAPQNLLRLAPLIRERAGRILDELPIGTEFDWVDKVSIELTAMTLATLLDFPQEERRLLTYWSDVITTDAGPGQAMSWAQKDRDTAAMTRRFSELWNERVNAPPKFDLVSMLAHGEATRTMPTAEFFGNMFVLVVGGNDTTRNTISASVHALHTHPEELRKLRDDPSLIPGMVSESIRWQTPIAHQARTATCDVELGGKIIRKGDLVVMWYLSGNRDPREIADPDSFRVDRERPRHHMSFGFGVHRCVGNRLAELQLTIIWEEILKRFPRIEVVGEPRRASSILIRAIESLPVVIPERL